MRLLRAFFAGWTGAAVVRAFSFGAAVLLAGWLSMDFLRWLTTGGMPIDAVAMTVVFFISTTAISLYWTVNNVLFPSLARSAGLAGPEFIVANDFAEGSGNRILLLRPPRAGRAGRVPASAPDAPLADEPLLVPRSGAPNLRGKRREHTEPRRPRRGKSGRRATPGCGYA